MYQVVVIVLNYNKRDLVLECLQSLDRQTYDSCSVVVFDNASNDGSQAAIKKYHPEVDLVCNPTNLGASGGRNAAVAYANRTYEFKYLLFLDDDAETGVDSIKLLVDALESDQDAGIACGKTYTGFDSRIIMSAGIRAQLFLGRCVDRGAGDEDRGQYDENVYVEACGAFAFLINARLFDELGGFDEIYSPYGWEDVDLCLRARSLGYKTCYVQKSVFAHKGTRLGRKPVLGYERNKAKNFLTLLVRHTSVLEKMSAVFFVPVRGLVLFTKFATQGNWRAIPAQLSGAVDFFLARKSKQDDS